MTVLKNYIEAEKIEVEPSMDKGEIHYSPNHFLNSADPGFTDKYFFRNN